MNHPTRNAEIKIGAWLTVIFLLTAFSSAWGAEPSAPDSSKAVTEFMRGVSTTLWILALGVLTVMIKAGRIATALLLGILKPEWIHRAGHLVATRPMTILILGFVDWIVVCILLAILAGLTQHLKFLILFDLLLIAWIIMTTLVGVSGVYLLLGRKLNEGMEPEWRQITKGGLLLESALALPILGWMAYCAVMCAGLGCGVMLLFGSGRPAMTVALEKKENHGGAPKENTSSSSALE